MKTKFNKNFFFFSDDLKNFYDGTPEDLLRQYVKTQETSSTEYYYRQYFTNGI